MRLRALTFALLAGTIAAPTTVQAEAILTAFPTETTAFVANFNPFNTSTRLSTVEDFMFEPLVIFNVLQGGKPEYRLAESFSYNDDLTAVTFKIRDGVKWSDGQPFTANDVLFTFNMLKDHPELDLNAIWTQIKGVTVDGNNVTVDFNASNSGLIYKLVQVYVVPEHVWKDVADPSTFTNDQKPVGSGPMTEITRFTPQEYMQCRNPNYWDAANLFVDCMRFPQIAGNDQALTVVTKGELDWFGSFLPDIEKTNVGLDPDHNAYWFPGGSMVVFNLNMQTKNAGNAKAFNDIAFRRAFSMAMDRQAMVDIAGYGYPTLNEYPSGLGAAFHAWNNPQVDAEYGQFSKYNIDAAKALLAEAGYKDVTGDGFLETPDGQKISFDIIVPNGWTDWVNTVQLAVEGLTQIGIEGRLSTPEEGPWDNMLKSGDFDVGINSIRGGVTPHFMFDLALYSANVGKTRQAASHYSNPELDKLLDSFYQTSDEAEQHKIMDEVQMIIGRDLPYVAVFNNPLWYEYSTKRFTGWFNADNPVARPVVYGGVPERVLHLLALRPVAQ